MCGMNRALFLRLAIRSLASAALPHITKMIHLLTDQPGAAAPRPGKFPLGQIVATPGALEAVPPDEMHAALSHHHHGEWGDIGEEDRQENERSLRDGCRVLSVFHTKGGVKFYVITEHDRSVTTVLLPEEY